MKDKFVDAVLLGSTESFCSYHNLNRSSARNSQAALFKLLISRIRKRKLEPKLLFEEEKEEEEDDDEGEQVH